MTLNHATTARCFVIAAFAFGMSACGTTKEPEVAVQAEQPRPLAAGPVNPVRDTGAPVTTPMQPPFTQTQAPPIQGPAGVGPGSIQDFVVNAGDRVYFDTDSFGIRDDARPILDAQAAWLNRYPRVTIRIEGNADERGTREYNFALGERRANAVRDYLNSRGVAGSRIEVVSYGKERPIDGGANESAWQRNRNGHTAITGGTN